MEPETYVIRWPHQKQRIHSTNTQTFTKLRIKFTRMKAFGSFMLNRNDKKNWTYHEIQIPANCMSLTQCRISIFRCPRGKYSIKYPSTVVTDITCWQCVWFAWNTKRQSFLSFDRKESFTYRISHKSRLNITYFVAKICNEDSSEDLCRYLSTFYVIIRILSEIVSR